MDEEKDVHKDFIKDYEIFRDYIKHEDGLINARTTWFITLNSFLFATLAIGSEGEARPDFWPFTALLSLIGLLLSATTLRVIRGAHRSLEVIGSKWKELKDGKYKAVEGSYPPIKGEPRGLHVPSKGIKGELRGLAVQLNVYSPSVWMPVGIGVAWIIIGAYSLAQMLFAR